MTLGWAASQVLGVTIAPDPTARGFDRIEDDAGFTVPIGRNRNMEKAVWIDI
jgi:hypothetical protein